MKEWNYLEHLDVDGRLLLKWSQRNKCEGCRVDSYGSEQRPVWSSCEHIN
jgi:hypothetical protein